MVDVVLDSADYLEQSLVWLAGVLDGSITVSRTDFAAPSTTPRGRRRWSAAGCIADMRTHGAAPAPYRALELIELSRTADLADGLRRRGRRAWPT